MNSKKKGARGELELAKKLTELGFNAFRGAQKGKGSELNPDVYCGDLSSKGYHIECKYGAHFKPYDALEQAKDDAPEKKALVAYRKASKVNGKKKWIVCMYLEEFLTNDSL